MGVWRDSDSVAAAAAAGADMVADTVGMVIFGLGFSIFTGSFISGLLESSGSILMHPKEETEGVGSESESESSILQMGRWASRTSSSFSFSFCNSAISFWRRDFSSSSSSVSYTRESRERHVSVFHIWLRLKSWHLIDYVNVYSRFGANLSAPADDYGTLLLLIYFALF